MDSSDQAPPHKTTPQVRPFETPLAIPGVACPPPRRAETAPPTNNSSPRRCSKTKVAEQTRKSVWPMANRDPIKFCFFACFYHYLHPMQSQHAPRPCPRASQSLRPAAPLPGGLLGPAAPASPARARLAALPTPTHPPLGPTSSARARGAVRRCCMYRVVCGRTPENPASRRGRPRSSTPHLLTNYKHIRCIIFSVCD